MTNADSDEFRAADALAVVPVAGASIATMGGILAVETVSSTDARIARVDELQFDLNEGPCWDALDSGLPVLEPDLLRAPRRFWPAFSPAIAEEHIGALFAFPMRVGPFRIGAIDLYDIDPHDLDDDAVQQAMEFAALAGRRILRRALRFAAAGEEVALPLHSRRVIHQATGFVIAQLGLPPDDAELLIRASAFAEGRSMSDIAEEIVDRRRRFTSDGTMIEDSE